MPWRRGASRVFEPSSSVRARCPRSSARKRHSIVGERQPVVEFRSPSAQQAWCCRGRRCRRECTNTRRRTKAKATGESSAKAVLDQRRRRVSARRWRNSGIPVQARTRALAERELAHIATGGAGRAARGRPRQGPAARGAGGAGREQRGARRPPGRGEGAAARTGAERAEKPGPRNDVALLAAPAQRLVHQAREVAARRSPSRAVLRGIASLVRAAQSRAPNRTAKRSAPDRACLREQRRARLGQRTEDDVASRFGAHEAEPGVQWLARTTTVNRRARGAADAGKPHPTRDPPAAPRAAPDAEPRRGRGPAASRRAARPPRPHPPRARRHNPRPPPRAPPERARPGTHTILPPLPPPSPAAHQTRTRPNGARPPPPRAPPPARPPRTGPARPRPPPPRAPTRPSPPPPHTPTPPAAPPPRPRSRPPAARRPPARPPTAPDGAGATRPPPTPTPTPTRRSIYPGERTGRFRLGGDQPVLDAEGRSRISFEDCAVALLDEAELPRRIQRRFTIGY